MIMIPKDFDPEAPVVVISIGNTNTMMGVWANRQVSGIVGVPTNDVDGFKDAFTLMVQSMPDGRAAAAVIASVVPEALKTFSAFIEDEIDKQPLVIGANVDRPIDVDETCNLDQVGMDRICCAAAAYERLEHSCVVVDFGTAITVDLINDDGVHMGGAILPGIRLQLQALHDHTAQLPNVNAEFPEDPIGRNTIQAIQNGVCRGICGAVRELVEAYATEINHWPQVVATGGDAVLIAQQCNVIDNIVPDLCLRGVGLAYTKRIASSGI